MNIDKHYTRFTCYNGAELILHDDLLYNLKQLALNVLEGDDDGIIVVTGKEGSGKTIHMYALLHILATLTKTTATTKNVHFDAGTYMDWAETQGKGTIGVFDEARRTLNKLRTIGKSQVEFTDWLSQSRDLNHIMIIGLPSAEDLVGYLTHERLEHRGFIIHQLKEWKRVKRWKDEFVLPLRGGYDFYSPEVYLAHLDNKKRAKYSMPEGQQEFYGYVHFKEGDMFNTTGFTDEELADLKQKKKYYRNQSRLNKMTVPVKYFYRLAKHLINQYGMNKSQVAELCDMDKTQFGNKYNAFEENDDLSEEYQN